MKLTPKKFLFIAIIVVIITLMAANWDEVKAAVATKAPAVSPGANGGAAPSATNPLTPPPVIGKRDYSKVLYRGLVTPLTGEVKELQTFLNKVNAANKSAFLAPLKPDNVFGAKTETMLKAYNQGIGTITLNEMYAKYQTAIGL